MSSNDFGGGALGVSNIGKDYTLKNIKKPNKKNPQAGLKH